MASDEKEWPSREDWAGVIKSIIASDFSANSFPEQYLTFPKADDHTADALKYLSSSTVRTVKSRVTNPCSEVGLIRGREITGVWLDEFTDIEGNDMTKQEKQHSEVHKALADLAERMTQWFQDHNETGAKDTVLSLLAPATLTVQVAGKGYRKHSHIGGEEFIPQSVYVGKTNRLIFVSKPVDAQPYSEMEMTENEAMTHLDKLRAVANMAAGGDFAGELKAIRELESKAREQEAMKDKFSEYADFGSW